MYYGNRGTGRLTTLLAINEPWAGDEPPTTLKWFNTTEIYENGTYDVWATMTVSSGAMGQPDYVAYMVVTEVKTVQITNGLQPSEPPAKLSISSNINGGQVSGILTISSLKPGCTVNGATANILSRSGGRWRIKTGTPIVVNASYSYSMVMDRGQYNLFGTASIQTPTGAVLIYSGPPTTIYNIA